MRESKSLIHLILLMIMYSCMSKSGEKRPDETWKSSIQNDTLSLSKKRVINIFKKKDLRKAKYGISFDTS
jgi:hypothetical protein